MKKKQIDMTQALEQYINGMMKLEDFQNQTQNEVAILRKTIEERYLEKIRTEVDEQNIEYFKKKAKELLLVANRDLFAKACASLLLSSYTTLDRS